MPDNRDPLESKMPKASRETLDFLYKCLDRDPSKRWTCEQLMHHKYFDGFTFRLPTSDLEEFEKIRKSNYGSTTGSTTTTTHFPHLSNNGAGSPEQYSHQPPPAYHQYSSGHTTATSHKNNGGGGKSFLQRDSRESFEHLPNI